MRIIYDCNECGITMSNKVMKCFACRCGGTMRTTLSGGLSIFKPYHCIASNKVITSSRQESRINRAEGVQNLGDCDGMRRRMKELRKNKEEVISERYAKLGLKYPKGKKVRISPDGKRFIPAGK